MLGFLLSLIVCATTSSNEDFLSLEPQVVRTSLLLISVSLFLYTVFKSYRDVEPNDNRLISNLKIASFGVFCFLNHVFLTSGIMPALPNLVQMVIMLFFFDWSQKPSYFVIDLFVHLLFSFLMNTSANHFLMQGSGMDWIMSQTAFLGTFIQSILIKFVLNFTLYAFLSFIISKIRRYIITDSVKEFVAFYCESLAHWFIDYFELD